MVGLTAEDVLVLVELGEPIELLGLVWATVDFAVKV